MRSLFISATFAFALLAFAPDAAAQSECRPAGTDCAATRAGAYENLDTAYNGCVPVAGYVACWSMWAAGAAFVEASYYACVEMPPCMIGGERRDPFRRKEAVELS